MKSQNLPILMSVIILIASACSSPSTADEPGDEIGMPNPASVY
jgi:putative hemolysin